MKTLPQMDQKTLLTEIADKKVMLFFTADWCPDCRFIKPAMPTIETKYSQFEFITVDRDENIDLCAELDVYGIPSFIAFENGQELGRFVNKDRKTQVEVENFIESL
ncbi:thioredoxin family protein [Periweissella fabalis]|uniref:Thioredoxin family protein n=1 Tax=Periweissella fabalis TaxID=1070421 RepID=A0A7X6S2V4_9LACO|nr:thioredoxin family protein [Periweissella fabalis]MCM0598822.1 thioredoxin family protein [Periweissella fabalis]NKZ24484.1 thioredoxin family protein [Periweissella fabalis]